MNKTQKRQLNLRNKLFAAIAMLLVSSIMMVSTTYAWFTLSTAPEVQGITTTVGANGNLEIALSPLSGDVKDLSSAMGDSNLDWTLKNLTWGNLLDLSNAYYNLDEIALMPTRLNATGTTALNLGDNPLQTPVYGADGRVSGLEAETYIGSKWEIDAETAGNPIVPAENFIANDYRGVRAVGTANNMSEYQAALNSARSALNSQIGSVQDNAEGSLNANGGVLTEIAILHATAADSDTNDYTEYVPTLRSVVNSLKLANNALDQAIRAAIRAMSAGATVETYEAVKAALEAENTNLNTIWNAIPDGLFEDSNPLVTAYNTWDAINGKLNTAETALETAEANVESSTKVEWDHVSDVLGELMSTTGTLEIGGKDLTQLKDILKIWKTGKGKDNTGDGQVTEEDNTRYDDALEFIGNMASGLNITLGSGTGMYYDFATVVGNLDASFKATISYEDMAVPNVPTTMQTTAPGSGAMNTVKLVLAGLTPIASDNSSNVIDETYGYIVDFFFRTNAAGSKLKLQTNAAQRIYGEGDSSNTDTMGHGSSMTFRTGAVSETTLQGLMGAIRVVFFDPASKAIYGIAKLDPNLMTRTVVVDNPEGAEDIVDVTAPLKLYEVTRNETTDVLEFGAEKTEANATLCDLPTNTATALSILVYLDGDNVTNADVASSGKSAVGTLNLQFASDATLTPMTNTDLKTGTGTETSSISFVNNTTGEKAATVVVNKTTVTPDTDYSFGLTGNGVYTVTYKVGETNKGTLTGTPVDGVTTYVIPGMTADELKDKNVEVTINAAEETPAPEGGDDQG